MHLLPLLGSKNQRKDDISLIYKPKQLSLRVIANETTSVINNVLIWIDGILLH